MRLYAKTLAAMLTGLAFAAFQPDSDAQSRGGSRSSSFSRSSSVSRSSGTTSASDKKRPSGDRSASVSRPASKPSKPSVDRPSKPSVDRPSKPSVERPSKPSVERPSKPSGGKPSVVRPQHGGHHAGKPDFKPGQQHQPVGVYRPSPHKPHKVHPRDRDFVHYTKPSHHWSSHHHCYGHRVRALPVQAHRHVYRGVIYYCYDNVWYRPYSGYYVVCRPPFGTVLAANLISDMAWTAVKLSYYNTVAETCSQINENNEYIAQQNAIIARNNATIAAQNAEIAQTGSSAQAAYSLADELGLVQSYAAAGTSCYYQDGVFYAADANGQYSVIIPPAGAQVESLPEDFDKVTLNGKEYYKVDDTIYMVTIVDGKACFEVLGQMN